MASTRRTSKRSGGVFCSPVAIRSCRCFSPWAEGSSFQAALGFPARAMPDCAISNLMHSILRPNPAPLDHQKSPIRPFRCGYRVVFTWLPSSFRTSRGASPLRLGTRSLAPVVDACKARELFQIFPPKAFRIIPGYALENLALASLRDPPAGCASRVTRQGKGPGRDKRRSP